MPKITVFHPPIPPIPPGNKDYTEFTGEGLYCFIKEGGTLFIKQWETEIARGDAIFAPGQWTYMCKTDTKR